MIGDVNAVADIVPVDLAVNMLVCTGWYAGTKRYVLFRVSTTSNTMLVTQIAHKVNNQAPKYFCFGAFS